MEFLHENMNAFDFALTRKNVWKQNNYFEQWNGTSFLKLNETSLNAIVEILNLEIKLYKVFIYPHLQSKFFLFRYQNSKGIILF